MTPFQKWLENNLLYVAYNYQSVPSPPAEVDAFGRSIPQRRDFARDKDDRRNSDRRGPQRRNDGVRYDDHRGYNDGPPRRGGPEWPGRGEAFDGRNDNWGGGRGSGGGLSDSRNRNASNRGGGSGGTQLNLKYLAVQYQDYEFI